MNEVTIRSASNGQLLREVNTRIQSGDMEMSCALQLIQVLLDKKESEKEFERRKGMDIELALVAAMGDKSQMYGGQTQLEFISEKLKPYTGKLYATTDKMVAELLEKENK